jgi:putative membrane protein
MLKRSLAQVARGLLMGAADVVPGVSGGTVALVVGIYPRLIAVISDGSHALGRLVRFDIRGFIARLRILDWAFLIPLLIGIGVAVVSMAGVIDHLLETQPVRMAALFFGLVSGSVVVAARLVQGWDARRVGITAVTAVVAFFVLGQRSGAVEDPSLLVYLAAGSIAICAMILPGISGSFLLLMMGMYDNVLGAVTDRDLVVLAVFMVGCVVGLALFSRALHWGLVHHEFTLLAALIGLMLGSLRVLWPWPDGTDTTTITAPAGDVVVPIIIAVIGFAVVVGVSVVGERLVHRTDAELAAELGSD